MSVERHEMHEQDVGAYLLGALSDEEHTRFVRHLRECHVCRDEVDRLQFAVDALRRNTVHDKRRASAEGIEERFEAREQTDVEVARRDEARTVRAAIEQLPSEQSRVIELAYFGGFSHSQIADQLEMPIGTVKGRMRLGLDKLRKTLMGDPEPA